MFEEITTISECEEKIAEQKRQIRLNEIANDSYYLSNQRKEDEQELKFWQKRVKELEVTDDRI